MLFAVAELFSLETVRSIQMICTKTSWAFAAISAATIAKSGASPMEPGAISMRMRAMARGTINTIQPAMA